MRITLCLLVLMLAGCAQQEAARLAALQGLVGKTEVQLVQAVGVPTRSFNTDDHRFLSYVSQSSAVVPSFIPYGPVYYKRYSAYAGPGYGVPPQVVTQSCDTTFDLVGGIVRGFTQRGDAC